MSLHTYVEKKFQASSMAIIDQANEIIEEYQADGFTLTLRQLYYQFVARDLLANKQSEYKRLGGIISDARRAGLIDWTAIEDRTRFVRSLPHWDEPADIIRDASTQFRIDRWETQAYRPEVWIEKDALTGVIEGVCNRYDVPYFSCRGYVSDSEMWRAGRRMREHVADGKGPLVLHFGDHDPSGIDMTRDIEDRIRLFMGKRYRALFQIERLALTRDQIDEFNPPPNPAKLSDSRAQGYITKHGPHSWELDALDPKVMAQLIEDRLRKIIDTELWADSKELEQEGIDKLTKLAERGI